MKQSRSPVPGPAGTTICASGRKSRGSQASPGRAVPVDDLFKGAGYLLSGFRLIRKPGLRAFVVIPLLVNLALFGGGAVLLYDVISGWTEAVAAWLPDWLDWLRYLIWPLVLLFFLGLVAFGFTAIANLIGAPFNGWLAARCAKSLGHESKEPNRALIAEVSLALAGEIRKIGYYLVRALPLLLLSLVPVIGVFASAALVALTIWMLALEYMDYPLGNEGMTFPEQRALLSRRRGLVFGFGGAVFATSLVPGLNLILMPTAVTGATNLIITEGLGA